MGLSALAGTLASAIVGVAVAAEDVPYGAPTDPSAYDHPLIAEQIAAEEQAAETEEAELQAPEAVAEREQSADAYKDLNTAEARELARETFDVVGAEQSFAPYEPPPGFELARYSGRFAALVVPEGAPESGAVPPGESSDPPPTGALVEASTPLRARNEQGELRPLSSELVPAEEGLEPQRDQRRRAAGPARRRRRP